MNRDKSPVTGVNHDVAADRIDEHFALVQHLLDHPEILEALPNGTVIEFDETHPSIGAWLDSQSTVHQFAGNIIAGERLSHEPTLSGTHMEGAGRSSQTSVPPTSHAQVPV